MIAFIILHYKNLQDTLEAIASIRKNAEKCDRIIVVDNATLTQDEIKILNDKCDQLILNKTNLGFAKANNIGCHAAIKKFHPNFLCVINNDIVICKKNFSNQIYKIYKATQFDMLGPKILTNNGDSVNPFPVYKTDSEINHAIRNAKMWIFIYKNFILRNIYKIYKKIKPQPKIIYKNGENRIFNVGLHGCAIIFSKKYYKKFPDVFFPDTFLYHEEEFLFERAVQNNLITVYDPKIEVFHKEGASLNSTFHIQKDKMIFKYCEIIKSLEKLKEYRNNFRRQK